MATYKVLQDIEAEDKLIGPLTLKQFIFAIITLVLIFIAFMSARANIILVIPWLLPIAFFGFMASPIGRDQPNDVWLAARLRFLIKPRKRIWDQSGMQELVTITAPKKQEIVRTDGLSQHEVRSRLNALANTLDSRGWAVKNVSVNMFTSPDYVTEQTNSDRLIDIANIPQQVPDTDIQAADDILDPMHNMVAQRFDVAIKQRQKDHVQHLKNIAQSGVMPSAHTAQPPVDYSFLNQPAPTDPGYATFGAQVVVPGAPAAPAAEDDGFLTAKPVDPTQDEAAFLEKRHREQVLQQEMANHGHARVIRPLSEQTPVQQPATPAPQGAPVTPVQTPANQQPQKAPDGILKELGQANLSVATIAGLARHAEQEAALHNNDVISLH